MMYGLTMSLKNEIVKIAPRGRVNTVAPGWVRTPMAEGALQNPNIVYQALATYAYGYSSLSRLTILAQDTSEEGRDADRYRVADRHPFVSEGVGSRHGPGCHGRRWNGGAVVEQARRSGDVGADAQCKYLEALYRSMSPSIKQNRRSLGGEYECVPHKRETE